MPKHSRDQETKVIRLKDYRQEEPQPQTSGAPPEEMSQPLAQYEYEEEASQEEYTRNRERRQLPRAVYHISLALLAVVIGLSLWVNREYLTWDHMKEWARLQLKGPNAGDGYPVGITGADVYEGNFLSAGGSVLVLSNTAFTSVNGDGKEEFSLRHSLNRPVLQAAGGKYLLYNRGSTGYLLVSGGRVAVEAVSGEDIICGSAAPNGKYALGLEGSHGASKLEVYMPDGSLQYEYPFANDYITAIALNHDGSFGAVCTVCSEKGEMVSRLTVLDFTQTDPVAQYETRDNLLLATSWGENGVIYSVGDGAMLSATSPDYQFTEVSYQGRQLTAFALSAGRAFLSISAYEHAGDSALLIYNGAEAYNEANPVRIDRDTRIEALSVSGGVVGMLAGGDVIFCDYVTGMELGRADAGPDAKSIALSSESRAYVLGVSEIRTVSANGKEADAPSSPQPEPSSVD